MAKLQIGISACLLGDRVRYNGGHKKNRWIGETLEKHAEFRPFCPEVSIGLPVPRPALRLIRHNNEIRAVDSKQGIQDVTDELARSYDAIAQDTADMDGYILMQGSPSCGMERVKVYDANNYPEKSGTGLFAKQLRQHHPHLPVEEAGRLEDPNLADSFLTRLFVYQQWRTERVFQSANQLIDFHSQHKFLLLMHNTPAYQRCGRLLSNLSKPTTLPEIANRYITTMMDGLKTISQRGQRTNTLLHLFGYLKNLINPQEKQLILEQINQYQAGLLPFMVPLNLIHHYAKLHSKQTRYLSGQSIWQPYPLSLMKGFL